MCARVPTGMLLRVKGRSSGEDSVDNLFMCREGKGRHAIFLHKYHSSNGCGTHYKLCQVLMSYAVPEFLHFTENHFQMCSGYMSPEYAILGHVSNKLDVFSFGVIILKIVTGQRNSVSSSKTMMAQHLLSYVSISLVFFTCHHPSQKWTTQWQIFR
jgi:serine/threonine protein kinase